MSCHILPVIEHGGSVCVQNTEVNSTLYSRATRQTHSKNTGVPKIYGPEKYDYKNVYSNKHGCTSLDKKDSYC